MTYLYLLKSLKAVNIAGQSFFFFSYEDVNFVLLFLLQTKDGMTLSKSISDFAFCSYSCLNPLKY